MPATVALIRDKLREAILAGELQPGEHATQLGLADRLGVSRTPLREALRMLELEGLVLRESNGRYRISPLSVDQIEDLAVMRINLEAVATSLTLPTFTVADHAKLAGLLAQMEHYATIKDWVGIDVPHQDFHRMLSSGAGDRMTALLGQLWNHASRYRNIAFQLATDDAEEWRRAQVEHRRIVDAVDEYDAREAVAWTAVQIARVAVLVARGIDPERPLHRVHEACERHTRGLAVLEELAP